MHGDPLAVGFGGLHVRNAVSLSEHGIDPAIGVVGVPGGEGVAEIRQCVQPGAVDLLDQRHQEERVFADRIVVLEGDDDVLCRGVLSHSRQAFRGAIEVRLGILRARNIGANAGRVEGRSIVHPLLAEGDGLLALGAIRRIGAVVAIHRDVHHGRTGLFHGGAKLRQILRIGGRKVSGPGLDLIDLELLDDVGGEIFQVHGLRGFALLARDELAEGIGGNGDAFSRLRRKLQIGSGTGAGQCRGQPRSGRCGRALLQKASSSKSGTSWSV